MIRQPTSRAAAYAWHSQALVDLRDHLRPDTPLEPQCGWFKTRLCRGGPFVPARIWLWQAIDQETGELVADEVLQCEVNGAYGDPETQWTWLAGDPITEAEFDFMTANRQWAAWHAPHEPAANPRQRTDWNTVPVPSFT
jgi:hypothetical protein